MVFLKRGYILLGQSFVITDAIIRVVPSNGILCPQNYVLSLLSNVINKYTLSNGSGLTDVEK